MNHLNVISRKNLLVRILKLSKRQIGGMNIFGIGIPEIILITFLGAIIFRHFNIYQKGPDGRIPDRLPDGRPAVAWENDGSLNFLIISFFTIAFIAGIIAASGIFGTPRPVSYFQASEIKAPVVTQRYEAKSKLEANI